MYNVLNDAFQALIAFIVPISFKLDAAKFEIEKKEREARLVIDKMEKEASIEKDKLMLEMMAAIMQHKK